MPSWVLRPTLPVLVAGFGILALGSFLLPTSPWVGWAELGVVVAVSVWQFKAATKYWPDLRRWLTLGVNITFGLLLLGAHLWPGHIRLVFAVSLALIVALRLAMLKTPTVRPPLT